MLLYKFSTTKLFSKLPFTYIWIIKRAIGEGVRTVLDLGCAKGIFTEVMARGEDWKIDGVEFYAPYIKEAEETGVYREVVEGDITNLPNKIRKRKYDVVLCHHVLEHIEKQKGREAIKLWEKIADRRVVIGTPNGFVKYEHAEEINRPEDDNELIEHKSGWTPEELAKLGYKVRGQGLKLVHGENGLAKKVPEFLLPILKLVSFVFSPIVYFNPGLAQIMICTKSVEK